MRKTKMPILKPARVVLALACLSMLLAACASAPAGKPVAQSLDERVQARWDHLLKGEYDEAYGYLSPGFRSSVGIEAYRQTMSQKKVNWTGARFIDSDCSEDVCKVRISLNYRLVAPVPGVPQYDGKQLIIENWVKSDNSWWHIPPN